MCPCSPPFRGPKKHIYPWLSSYPDFFFSTFGSSRDTEHLELLADEPEVVLDHRDLVLQKPELPVDERNGVEHDEQGDRYDNGEAYVRAGPELCPVHPFILRIQIQLDCNLFAERMQDGGRGCGERCVK
jgi:hypothetical protein